MRQSILILVLGIVSFCACHTRDKEKTQLVAKPRETIALPEPIDSIEIDDKGHKRSTYQKLEFEFDSDSTFVPVITHGNIRSASTGYGFSIDFYKEPGADLDVFWSSRNSIVLGLRAGHSYEYKIYTKQENYAIKHEIAGIIAFDTLTDNFMYDDMDRNTGLSYIYIANTSDFKVVAQINLDDFCNYTWGCCHFPCSCLQNIRFGRNRVVYDVYNDEHLIKKNVTLNW